jgi:hypothetical protein
VALQLRGVLQFRGNSSRPIRVVERGADMRIEIAVWAFGRAEWPMHVNSKINFPLPL